MKISQYIGKELINPYTLYSKVLINSNGLLFIIMECCLN